MTDPMHIQDMTAAQISQLLMANDCELTAGQATALGEFVERIGGMENAWTAVKMLGEMEQTH